MLDWMTDATTGRSIRALRRRRGWRQVDLAGAARCSQTLVSLVERGHVETVSLRTLRQVLAALDAVVLLQVQWRGAALDRLLDEEHAALVGMLAKRLRELGWQVEIEVTYSRYGERGSFDLLATMPGRSIVLVIEVKTDLPSVEATLRKLDEKARLAPVVARERFGWAARDVARLLVMPESSTLRRRTGRHSSLFERALPVRGAALRQWLDAPDGPIKGLWFLSGSNPRGAIGRAGGRERVRRLNGPPRNRANAA